MVEINQGKKHYIRIGEISPGFVETEVSIADKHCTTPKSSILNFLLFQLFEVAMGEEKGRLAMEALKDKGEIMSAEDVAWQVEHVLSCPKHIQVGEIVVRPAQQKQQ